MEESLQLILEKIALLSTSVFLVLVLSIFIYKTLVFLVSNNIFSKIKITQNLDNWIGKYYFILSLLIIVASFMTLNEEQLLYVVGFVFVVWIVLDRFNLFSSLDKELFKVFNEDKWWFDNKTFVEKKFLDEDTYKMQNKKIKSELDKASSHTEHYHKLDKELSETIGIISNINEIYKKSLQNLTTMSNNKELLKNLYNELVNRYEYFEIKYHELLQQNYSVKKDIQKVQKNDKENEELKNNLKNI